MLAGKKILLGVSGSIAAYKAPDILRRLADLGAEVRVVLSRNAARFVTPLTFAAVSGKPVLADEFSNDAWGPMGHIAVTEGIDAVVVAPATADIIGKAASGIADDALSTVLLCAACPVIMAPAMNTRMYRNASVQRNIELLRRTGVRFIEPECGRLACGAEGEGKLASVTAIVEQTVQVLALRSDLAGQRVLVTSGPTREPIDAARFISNPSTGKMGHAVAAEARLRGAEVVLVTGPTSLQPPAGVTCIDVATAAEMRMAVLDQFPRSTVLVMAAAVSDFRPAAPVQGKIKKENAELVIRLERTDDILRELSARKESRIVVGFAAETGDLAENARKKLEQKALDLVIANPIGRDDAGFGADTNEAIMIDRNGKVLELPCMSKKELAGKLLDKVGELLANQGV